MQARTVLKNPNTVLDPCVYCLTAASFGPELSGVTYIQWGKKQCTAGGVQTLYSGVVAGPSYTNSGGGANTQCLPLNPEWSKFKDGVQGESYTYRIKGYPVMRYTGRSMN